MPSVQVKRTVSSVQTDISSSIKWDTFQLSQVLTKEVSKLQFLIIASPAKVIPNLGDQIDVYQNSVHIFGGTVTEKETSVAGGILPQVHYTITDWSFRLDSKLVHKTYAQQDPADILKAIINEFTDGTYTTVNVQQGNFLVPSIKFNYEPVTKCIQKLASLIGWDWYVDPNKDVHFFLAENNPAPFNIDDTNGNQEWPSIDIDQDLTNMKNSVYVIGGYYKKTFIISNTPDIYQTDGVKTVFSLAYTYESSNIYVTLDGVLQSIGIENQITDPSTVQILYNPTNRYIRFTTLPSSGKTVKIYGDARVPILAHKSDPTGINTFGEIQDSIIDRQITSVAEAQARANAEIKLYGHAIYTVKFKTIQAGLKVGQIITLNSAKLGFTGVSLTIKRLVANGYTPFNIRWDVECYGSDQVTFVDIISTLLAKENQDNSVTDDTILETLLSLEEDMIITDLVFKKSTSTGPYKWDFFNWNFGVWG